MGWQRAQVHSQLQVQHIIGEQVVAKHFHALHISTTCAFEQSEHIDFVCTPDMDSLRNRYVPIRVQQDCPLPLFYCFRQLKQNAKSVADNAYEKGRTETVDSAQPRPHTPAVVGEAGGWKSFRQVERGHLFGGEVRGNVNNILGDVCNCKARHTPQSLWRISCLLRPHNNLHHLNKMEHSRKQK